VLGGGVPGGLDGPGVPVGVVGVGVPLGVGSGVGEGAAVDDGGRGAGAGDDRAGRDDDEAIPGVPAPGNPGIEASPPRVGR